MFGCKLSTEFFLKGYIFLNTSIIHTFKSNWHITSLMSLLGLYQAFICQVYEYKNWSIPCNPKSQNMSLLLPGVGNSTIIKWKKIFHLYILLVHKLYYNDLKYWYVSTFRELIQWQHVSIIMIKLNDITNDWGCICKTKINLGILRLWFILRNDVLVWGYEREIGI